MSHATLYDFTRRENEKHAKTINAAWGAEVAWVEDRSFTLPSGGKSILPVIVSKIVNGLVPGLTPPPFLGTPLRRAA